MHAVVVQPAMRPFACCLFTLLALPGLFFAQPAKPGATPDTDPLEDSVALYKSRQEMDKSMEFANLYLAKTRKDPGKDSIRYGKALAVLANAYHGAQQPQEAQQLYLKSLAIRQRALGPDALLVGETHHKIGSITLVMLGDGVAAEPHLLKAEEIKARLLPPDDLGHVITYRNLAQLYTDKPDFDKAEKYFQKSLAILRKHYPDTSTEVADAYGELSILYCISMQFPKAETYSLKSLDLFARFRPPDKMPSGPYNTLGHIYDNLGNFQKAEQYYKRSLALIQSSFPEIHPLQFRARAGLGGHYILAGQYRLAVKWLEEAVKIEKAFPPEMVSPDDNFGVGNLLIAYLKLGYFKKAEDMGKEVVAKREKLWGPLNSNTANGYSALVEIYQQTGRFTEALPYIEKMEAAYLHSYGSRFFSGRDQFATGHFFWDKGDIGLAKVRMVSAMGQLKEEVTKNFPSLSDHEKAQFYADRVQWPVSMFSSFSLDHFRRFPDLAAEQYNLILSTKAMLLSTSARWKQRIKKSGDTRLFGLFTQWEGLQNQLAGLTFSAQPGMDRQRDSLVTLSEKLEKELSLLSEKYGKPTDRQAPNWKQVQARLKPGEAAIEMLRIRKWGVKATRVDSSDERLPGYKIKGMTDTIQYAALIVRPESVQPEWVIFPRNYTLETKALAHYQNCVKRRVTDDKSYRQFWEPISKKLGPDVRKVYFSPEGVYHHLNLNILFNPKTKKYVLDELDIRLVTTTRDIVAPAQESDHNNLAVLLGFPDFDLDEKGRKEPVLAQRNAVDLSYTLNMTRGDAVSELPGTKVEVESISGILTGKGWEVQTLKGKEAMEEALKDSFKPKVLHLATHGFFNPDTSQGSNPLLRSGLLLSGANLTLLGKRPEKGDDGILTAYEAMNLNLDNTELVVLSACETGLGEIQNGEGVYGLQRAFKVAGAKSLIMSLWKVHDEATQELMVSFYKNWLSTPNGTKRAAFLKAQRELKAKYPQPYFWGAFVMVGE